MLTMDLKNEGNVILVIGKTEGHIDQSVFARNILNEKKGPPPEINLFNEKNNGSTVMKLMKEKLLTIRAGENVVRILPPLNVSKKEIDQAVTIINKVCKSYK